jgi:hypothetical protein|tara:strand:- start:340 stop:486 length:147 start_codon:yes stop_codon:yes gene_type:complete
MFPFIYIIYYGQLNAPPLLKRLCEMFKSFTCVVSVGVISAADVTGVFT